MSEAEAAGQADNLEEDCPLCLEPLPPFWDIRRRVSAVCCGQYFCKNCQDQRDAVLLRARAEGSYGKEEEQLNSTCPLCRTQIVNVGRMMAEKYETGQLPLSLYGQLAGKFVNGTGGVERDVEKGVEIFLLGAEKGHPNCQFLVGCRYDDGTNGLPKSTTEAKRWWLAAAGQGHAVAEYNLALTMKEEGDDDEYVRHMRGSASNGYDEACYHLGLARYYGKNGLQRSLEESIRVLTPAAERGDAQSMGLLGFVMCDPDLLPATTNHNFTKGMHWLRRAATTGDKMCISQLRELEEIVSNKCFRCNKEASPGRTLLRCSRCRAAWYCSKDCQVQHWTASEGGHKQCCIKWE